MSFWSTLTGWFGGAPANPEIGVQRPVAYGTPREVETNVSDERAMKLSAVFACGRIISGIGGSLPLDLFRKDDDGSRIELDKRHHLVRLLRNRPNQYMNAKEFRRTMLACRVWWGNAYAEIGWSGGKPTFLLPIHPAKVTVYRQADGIKYRIGTEENGRELYNRNGQNPQMFHLKGMSTDGVIGMSPLGYAAHSLGISIAAEQKVARGMTGVPFGFFTTDEILTNEDREELREVYSELGNPFTGDGSIYLMEGGFKFQEVGMSPDDLQMLESRSFQVADIARFFGVPSVMIDAAAGASASWPASYEQQQMSFLTFTLKEYLEEFEEKVTECLVASNDGAMAEHNVSGLLRTDAAARAGFYSTMAQNGIMTRNEIRKLENLPKSNEEGADDLTIQVNLAGLDSATEEPEPGPEPVAQIPPPTPPDQAGKMMPEVTVNIPPMPAPNVTVEAPQVQFPAINLRLDRDGSVTKEIVETDAQGFPIKIIERPADGIGRAVLKQVTEWDDEGFPKKWEETPLTDEEDIY